MKFARPGLKPRKEKLTEAPGQRFPQEWTEKAMLPEKHRPA
jgi:hypothetical protein